MNHNWPSLTMVVGSYVGPVKLSRAVFRGSYGTQMKPIIYRHS